MNQICKQFSAYLDHFSLSLLKKFLYSTHLEMSPRCAARLQPPSVVRLKLVNDARPGKLAKPFEVTLQFCIISCSCFSSLLPLFIPVVVFIYLFFFFFNCISDDFSTRFQTKSKMFLLVQLAHTHTKGKCVFCGSMISNRLYLSWLFITKQLINHEVQNSKSRFLKVELHLDSSVFSSDHVPHHLVFVQQHDAKTDLYLGCYYKSAVRSAESGFLLKKILGFGYLIQSQSFVSIAHCKKPWQL